jgi:cell fate regulator YaaT (PSP1 superfamily)
MINVVGVTFQNKKRVYYFSPMKEAVLKGNNVIVSTEKGNQFGTVELEEHQIEEQKLKGAIKPILRLASDKDREIHQKNLEDAKKALQNARKIAERMNLNMYITSCEYTFNKEQLMFKFLADDRVDFRNFVKELASIYHTRIELFQIGVRDKAKDVGGIGPCGLVLCCNKFLNEFETVSINMAKNQNIALNPSKINGQCGRLLCCLKYEDECYKECKKHMPKVGSKYVTDQGEGKVSSVDIFNNSIRVYVPECGIVEVKLSGSN